MLAPSIVAVGNPAVRRVNEQVAAACACPTTQTGRVNGYVVRHCFVLVVAVLFLGGAMSLAECSASPPALHPPASMRTSPVPTARQTTTTNSGSATQTL
jgi:hypothetical protein